MKAWLFAILGILLLLCGLLAWYFWPTYSPPSGQNNSYPAHDTTHGPSLPAASASSTISSSTSTSTISKPPLITPLSTSTPGGFTAAFYHWYLHEFNARETSPTNPQFLSLLGQWATPDLIAGYKDAASNLDTDSIILDSDIDPAWASRIVAEVESQSAQSAIVLVSMGTQDPIKKLLVTLTYTNAGLRVSKITSAH